MAGDDGKPGWLASCLQPSNENDSHLIVNHPEMKCKKKTAVGGKRNCYGKDPWELGLQISFLISHSVNNASVPARMGPRGVPTM